MSSPMKLLLVIILGHWCCNGTYGQEWGDQIPPDEVYVQEPVNYDGSEATPLIIFLHGYGPVNGGWADALLIGVADPAYYEGYLFTAPNGSYDSWGFYFWDGGEACCDFDDANPDHVGYIEALVDSIQMSHNVDPQRIHLIGYSNGGFMAHRIGCEQPDLFASMISIAGTGSMDMYDCLSTSSLSMLQIHGTLDTTILYNGGELFGVPYPSVETTMTNWSKHIGCKSNPVASSDYLNLDGSVWGDETEVIQYTNECNAIGEIELWKMHGATHTYWFWYEAFEYMFDWFDAHQKPNTCLGDFDGDSTVNVHDLLILIGHWGTASGDLNGDQTTTVSDVLVLIGAWGQCP